MRTDVGPSSDDRTPDRERISTLNSLAALAAGPTAWIAQLVIGYGISSLACFPHDIPRLLSSSHASTNEAILAVLNLACLALAVTGFILAATHWRRLRHAQVSAREAVDVGHARARFLAVCGMLGAWGFAVAILFDMPAIVAVPACWSAI